MINGISGASAPPQTGAANFDRMMKGAGAASGTDGAEPVKGAGDVGALEANGAQIKQLLEKLMQLIETLKQILGDGGGGKGGASGGGKGGASGGGASPARREGNNIVNESGTGGEIPPPTQNVEQFQLGGKTVTIGSDGSASAQEVAQVKATLQQMYQNSPSFRQAIDNSSHQEMSVTLGRRGDNTSWGGGGNVFLNLNNIGPGDGDAFEELTAHEFGHAASSLDHGSELDAFQRRVAAET